MRNGTYLDRRLLPFIGYQPFEITDANGSDTPIYQARHLIHTGQQTLTLRVPSEPALAALDPLGKLIERERGDNMVEVEKGP